MKKLVLITIPAVMLLTGCSMNQIMSPKKESSKPKWFLDPYMDNDKYAAVACAKEHFNGPSAQKKLAISRAIDEIAKSKEVSVNSNTLRTRSSGSLGSSSAMNSSSLQNVDNVKISTKVKDVYHTKDGEICVWVVSR